MKRRGFSFLEALVALAILALLSVSLMPLLTGLANTDRQLRDEAEAWHAARAGLTALYLNDANLWEEASVRTRFHLESGTTLTPGGTVWKTLTAYPAGTDMKPALCLYLTALDREPVNR